MQYLFVYGTLRRGAVSPMRDQLMRGTRFCSHGYVSGRLYDVGGYPGLILSRRLTERVTGEVYRINDPDGLLQRLDEYEECSEQFTQPWEYRRTQLTVTLQGGGSQPAWAYLYNHPVSESRHIRGGDYIAYMIGNRGKTASD